MTIDYYTVYNLYSYIYIFFHFLYYIFRFVSFPLIFVFILYSSIKKIYNFFTLENNTDVVVSSRKSYPLQSILLLQAKFASNKNPKLSGGVFLGLRIKNINCKLVNHTN